MRRASRNVPEVLITLVGLLCVFGDRAVSNIRAADACCSDVHEAFVCAWLGDGGFDVFEFMVGRGGYGEVGWFCCEYFCT